MNWRKWLGIGAIAGAAVAGTYDYGGHDRRIYENQVKQVAAAQKGAELHHKTNQRIANTANLLKKGAIEHQIANRELSEIIKEIADIRHFSANNEYANRHTEIEQTTREMARLVEAIKDYEKLKGRNDRTRFLREAIEGIAVDFQRWNSSQKTWSN